MIINNTICFIHIPKAGGSTIEHLLIQNETNYINYIILIIIELSPVKWISFRSIFN